MRLSHLAGIGLLGWMLGSLTMAQTETAPERRLGSALCREESRLLEDLRVEVARLATWNDSLDALSSGTLSSDVSLEDLFGDEPEDGTEPESDFRPRLGTWPEQLDCSTLAQDYELARKDLLWLQRSIERKRQAFWSKLSDTQRTDLRDVWASRQRLLARFEILQADLQDQPEPASAAALQAIRQVYEDLQVLRLALLRLLPVDMAALTPEQARAFLQIWRRSVETAPHAALPGPSDLALLPEAVRPTVAAYRALARRDLELLRRQLNLLRATFWEQGDPASRRAAELEAGGMGAMLVLELRTFVNGLGRVARSLVDREGLGLDAGSDSASVAAGVLKYLCGLAAFPLLGWLARWLARPALALQQRIALSAQRNRPGLRLARLSAAIPPLLPWVAGWFGLDVLLAAFLHWDLEALAVLVPLARLYIIFNVVSLAGVWLLLGIAQQAGVYVSAENTSDVELRSRRAAAVVMLPWFLHELVGIAIGGSVVAELVSGLTAFAVFVALDLLLTSRRSDLARALQSFLPQRADAWVGNLLSGWRFWLTAPLAIPPLLLWWVLNAGHRVLLEFDGYRKLAARGFRLRAQSAERGESEADSGVGVADDYGRWFVGADANDQLPRIDVGLQQSIRSLIDPWLGDRTEENNLLLTGPRGIGKSLAARRLSSAIAQEFPDLAVRHIDVPAKTVSREAVDALIGAALDTDITAGPAALVKTDADRAPTLLVLDNAQNFFLRRVGGLDGWQALLALTNARVANLFWVIVINDQSWAYLANVFARDYQFRKVLRAKAWSQSDIRSLILSRNQLSGYRIRYDDVLLASRGPEAGNVRNAEQRYFSLLWDACGGNPMLALHLWMTSIRTQGRTVNVGLPLEPSTSVLERLAGDFHFVYAAIVIHENMSSDELVEVTALGSGVVRAALKTAFDAGFVDRGADGRYRLVPVWSPTVISLLTRKNLLHG